jgi:hypothetical protein
MMTSPTCTPALTRRRIVHDVGDQRAVRRLELQRLGDLRRHLLDVDAEPAANDLSLLLELRDELLGEIDGDREADADVAARAAVDGGVDADHLALEVHEGAARVARVDGGVGLNEVVVAALADEATLGADDAGRDRVAQAEGIADREDPVADAQIVGIAEVHRRQLLAVGIDTDHGEIGLRIASDDLRLVLLVGRGLHDDLVGILDDVIVGHDQAVGVDDETGSQAALLLLARLAEVALERFPELAILFVRIAAGTAGTAGPPGPPGPPGGPPKPCGIGPCPGPPISPVATVEMFTTAGRSCSARSAKLGSVPVLPGTWTGAGATGAAGAAAAGGCCSA